MSDCKGFSFSSSSVIKIDFPFTGRVKIFFLFVLFFSYFNFFIQIFFSLSISIFFLIFYFALRRFCFVFAFFSYQCFYLQMNQRQFLKRYRSFVFDFKLKTFQPAKLSRTTGIISTKNFHLILTHFQF